MAHDAFVVEVPLSFFLKRGRVGHPHSCYKCFDIIYDQAIWAVVELLQCFLEIYILFGFCCLFSLFSSSLCGLKCLILFIHNVTDTFIKGVVIISCQLG